MSRSRSTKFKAKNEETNCSTTKSVSSTKAGREGAAEVQNKKSGTRRRGGDDGWGGFKNYMDAKKQKLELQYGDSDRSGTLHAIFSCVAVYVNGYTTPSSDELRKMICGHGGRFETYLSKTRVTHIVASNLPNSKLPLAKTLPVVKPSWVTDSVAAGKRLSLDPYLLYGNQSRLQPCLESFSSVSLPSSETTVGGHQENKRLTRKCRQPSLSLNDQKPQPRNSEISSFNNNCRLGKAEETASRSLPVRDAYEVASVEGESKETPPLQDKTKSDIEDDDIVYDSEDEGFDNVSSCCEVTLCSLSKDEKANKKRLPRVYSFRKTRKSSSGSFGSPWTEDSNSPIKQVGHKSVVRTLSGQEGDPASPAFHKVEKVDAGQGTAIVSGSFNPKMPPEPSITVRTSVKSGTETAEVCAASTIGPSTSLWTATSLTTRLCEAELPNPSTLTSSSSSSFTQSKPFQKISSPLKVDNKKDVFKSVAMPVIRPITSSSSLSSNCTLPAPHSTSSTTSPQGKRSTSVGKAGDSNFLSEFYANSRLHHISTWGAEFKAYVSDIQKSGSTSFPGRDRLRSAMAHTSSSAHCGKRERTVMHIDMDCFFVSVGLLERPDLRGLPVAVTHSRGQGAPRNPGSNASWEMSEWRKKKDGKLKGAARGTLDELHEDENSGGHLKTGEKASSEADAFHSMAEIASCSYEARKAGLKNGMFMGRARQLCPDLQTVPYNFAEYNRISKILYDTVASFTHDIEAVSCDEMFIDCTDLLTDTGATSMEFASLLRSEIMTSTGCAASCGIGPNILLARLATRAAKPNGQYEVTSAQARDFIKDQSVSDLPGVGYSMSRKLAKLNVSTCGDLQSIPVSVLRREFGPKTGESLQYFSLGQDDRQVRSNKQRKSVSAEVNYGIRFTKEPEAIAFLQELSAEVKRRLDAIEVKGRNITLKLMVRRPDAPIETAKFMGHGICTSSNKTSSLPVATADRELIAREVISLYRAQRVEPSDVRGIGIQIHKLESSVETSRLSGAGFVSTTSRPRGHQSILQFTVARDKQCGSMKNQTDLAQTASDVDTMPGSSSNRSSIQNSSTPGPSGFPASYNAGSFKRVLSAHPPLDPTLTDFTKFKPRESLSVSVTEAGCCPVLHPVNLSGPVCDVWDEPLSGPSTSGVWDKPGPSESGHRPEPRDNTGGASADQLSISQIDTDVLEELPGDIVEEIMEDLQRRKQEKLVNIEQRRSSESIAYRDRHASRASKSGGQSTETHTESEGTSLDPSVSANTAVLPSLSQLDLDCFNALPSHLQQELQAEYAKLEVMSEHSARKKATLVKCGSSDLQRGPGYTFKVPIAAGRRDRPVGRRKLNYQHSKFKESNAAKSKRLPFTDIDSDAVVYIGRDDPTGCECPNIRANLPRRTKVVAERNCPGPSSVKAIRQDGQVSDSFHCSGDTADASDDNDISKSSLSLCGARTFSEVTSLLKEWMASGTEPQADDSVMVQDYLISLVEYRDLEQAFAVLKFLIRRTQCLKLDPWTANVVTICDRVQNFICAVYGATLKL